MSFWSHLVVPIILWSLQITQYKFNKVFSFITSYFEVDASHSYTKETGKYHNLLWWGGKGESRGVQFTSISQHFLLPADNDWKLGFIWLISLPYVLREAV